MDCGEQRLSSRTGLTQVRLQVRLHASKVNASNANTSNVKSSNVTWPGWSVRT